MRTLLLSACVAVVGVAPVAPAAPAWVQDRTAPLRASIADKIVAVARDAERAGLPATVRTLCNEALDLVPDHAAASKLRDAASGDDPADEAARTAFDRKRDSAGRAISKGYLQLWSVRDPKAKPAQTDPPLVRALAWSPKTAGRAFDSEWRSAQGKGDWDRVASLLGAAQAVVPDKTRAAALQAAEFKVAEKQPLKRRCRTHRIEYWIQLPKDWTRARTWPLLVTMEGAGSNFLGSCRGFANTRGDRPYIVVAPITFLNTNAIEPAKYTNYEPSLLSEVDTDGRNSRVLWDEAGLLAILEEVRADFNAEPKHYMTGFSGGGLLTWFWIFHHPEQLAGAAPACPNYIPLVPDRRSDDPCRAELPIHVYQGDADANLPALEQQWQGAQALAQERGYTKLERTMLPGVKHSACQGQVLDFFDSLRTGRK